jgi:hypothetical protein
MNTQPMTKEQVNRRYRGRYIEIYQTYDYQNRRDMYKVIKVYKSIHENTTLGEDVGTPLEYTR